MGQSYPLLNGKRLGWASISCFFSKTGQTIQNLKGFNAINYKVTVERGEARGHGRYPLGHTDGIVSYEAGVTCQAEEANEFIISLGGMDEEFAFTVAFKPLGKQKIFEVTMECTGINEWGGDHSQGPDALEMPMPFSVVRILKDGEPLTKPDE